jgi:NAD(P)-dependent dehydrogenase (short-subunit alcohol dehydrogenase family)
MKAAIDKGQFGPWALVTDASSGIGKEFARQIAASGINVMLVARREALLQEVGRRIAADFKVDYRVLAMDLSQEDFLARLAGATNDLDIGLARHSCAVEQLPGARSGRARDWAAQRLDSRDVRADRILPPRPRQSITNDEERHGKQCHEKTYRDI